MKKDKPRIVIDTNTIVSAAIFKGIPAQVVNLVLLEKVEGYCSEEIIQEVAKVLSKKFLYSPNEVGKVEESIRQDFSICIPSVRLNVVRDPDDNKILEAAIEGKCQYIVTGDKDLLELKEYRNIKIVTPKDFIEEFTA